MTNDAHTSGLDDPASTTEPSQPLAAALLTAGVLPATTAAPVATGPK